MATAGPEITFSREAVRFAGPPVQRPYGLESLLKDDSGNWFSLVERPR